MIEAFLKNVAAEARDNVARLRHHPSIALWCGNNEIMFFRGGKQWTDDKMSEGDYYKLFRDTLGGEVHRLAPQSDYVTGSPDCGDVHFWDVWHGGKPFEVYRNIHGFVSEFGFQSFPEPKTVRTFTTAADRQSVYSPVMKYHERSNRMYMDVKEDGRIGTDKIMVLVKKYFREPKDFESTLWLSQITQGYGIKYGAEGWRREEPKSMGCVYWQYNDCWPCSSWSSVDYFGRWKALQYMARRFYAPLLVSGVEDVKGRKVDLYVTSDRRENCQGSLRWTITDVSGVKIDEGCDRCRYRGRKEPPGPLARSARCRREARPEQRPGVAEAGRRRPNGFRESRHAGLSSRLESAGPGPVGRDCRERAGRVRRHAACRASRLVGLAGT